MRALISIGSFADHCKLSFRSDAIKEAKRKEQV